MKGRQGHEERCPCLTNEENIIGWKKLDNEFLFLRARISDPEEKKLPERENIPEMGAAFAAPKGNQVK